MDAVNESAETDWVRESCPSRWVEPMWSPEAIADSEALTEEISEREQGRPWVFLADDGELEDVNRILDEIGTSTFRLSGSCDVSEWRHPKRLLVVSDRQAMNLGRSFAREEEHFTKMVVMEKPSHTLRERLDAVRAAELGGAGS